MFWLWTGFVVFVLVMLALDLFVVNRRAHVIGSRQSLIWTGVTVVLALSFSGAVYVMYAHNWLGIAEHALAKMRANPYGHGSVGREAMVQFIAGWLTEYSLSLDNIFVIAVIFSYFRVPPQYQHRVLMWGILGALIMRGAMIGIGAALLERFDWMTYVLGGLLLITALRMLITGDEEPDPERGWALRAARRLIRVSPGFDGERFFVRLREPGSPPGARGRLAATPLFLVLVVVETTDVVFAVDSIPAIFSITTDPFLVFTSNVFALLGLRSLYFALASFMGKFRYLKASLVFVLAFVGVKMLLHDVRHIPSEVSLAIIAGILAVGIGASLLASRRESRARPAPVTDLAEAAEEAWRRSRRYVIFVVGSTIVVTGVALGALPGPGGIPIVLAGLAILATEFMWARRLLRYAREKAENTLQKQGPWVVVIGAVTTVTGVALMVYHHPYWGIPVLVSGAGILGTEFIYNRYLRRRAARLAAEPAGAPAPAARAGPTPAAADRRPTVGGRAS
jgi:tellurite resistance protein TerC